MNLSLFFTQDAGFLCFPHFVYNHSMSKYIFNNVFHIIECGEFESECRLVGKNSKIF